MTGINDADLDYDLNHYLPKWTREQFEDYYNHGDRSWISRGRLSIECHEGQCQEDDESECRGWKMTHVDWLEDDQLLYGNTHEEVQVALRHRVDLLATIPA